jgi:aspartate-semialdehyde dehydrogenase
VANPNCVTVQLVVALAALRRVGRLLRVDVASYQAASGAGEAGRAALRAELRGERPAASPFPRPLAGNLFPQIGAFDPEGWTEEERKLQRETQKILEDPVLAVTGTCVRVPVDVGHSVAACATFAARVDPTAARAALAAQPGLRFAAEPTAYPTPLDVAGRDEVFVGRLRADPFDPARLHLWIVADNLRKGAATNAVQILETLWAQGRLRARTAPESLPH